ncbi:MAG: deferrochelatase/peroxidase EfeB [Frankiales bacterium]|nr:deferrochelatase/peroxidase EfeB [Frankiales bacterium]
MTSKPAAASAEPNNPTHAIQGGIAFEQGQRPDPCYRLVLLNINPGTNRAVVHDCLRDTDELLRGLQRGHIAELAGQPAELAAQTADQFASLQHLLAFGRRLFDGDIHDPPITDQPRPTFLSYLPTPGPFPSLRWSSTAESVNVGEADVAVQLTASSQDAVNCAAVELWKLLQASAAPMRITASFAGFGRHDGRGWLEFHDGVTNMQSSQRLYALQASDDPPWMARGTYMAFLKLAVDLGAWHQLSRPEQEIIVGRDKLTGGPLVSIDRLDPTAPAPLAAPRPDDKAGDSERADFFDPPQSADRLVEASHVHRANQNRASPLAAGALRIFRQGYEFLDGFGDAGPNLGLNFVSFQRDLSAFQHVLHLPGWLGDVNFGGPAQPEKGAPAPLQLVSVLAGGLYAVPPISDPFPGSNLFNEEKS